MISANFTGGEAEELRRAMGFKRSQARMKEIEAKLRAGMTRNGLTQEAQEQIILSITSFALYGFPESHAASFALIAYASAWLKCHYLGAFTAALLNNQPMGFYHPATIVKDAQRHGLKILPVDVTKSDWLCTLEPVVSRQPSVVSESKFPVPSSQFSETQAISCQMSAISVAGHPPSAISENVSGHGFSRAVQAATTDAALAAVEAHQPSVLIQTKFAAPPHVKVVNRFIAGQGFTPPPETFASNTSIAPAEATNHPSSAVRFVSGRDFSRAVQASTDAALAAESKRVSPQPFDVHQPTWNEIGAYAHSDFVPAAQRPSHPAFPSAQEMSLKICHPERSEGPAFSSRTAPTSPNLQSEITNPNSSVSEPTLNEAEGCLCGENKRPALALRLGLNYVRGLRESAAQALVRERSLASFQSIHDLARRVPELRKDELTTLAEIGALNSIGDSPQRHGGTEKTNQELPYKFSTCHSGRNEGFIWQSHKPVGSNCQSEITNEKSQSSSVSPCLRGEKSTHSQLGARYSALGTRNSKLHRRDALWQVEKAVRRSGPLLEEFPEPDFPSPLAQMTHEERLIADFHGTGLTVGPHPMAYHRAEMKALGIRSASELKFLHSGQRLRIGGCVIARQRPGTAKGFIFLSIEDETGIANAIVHPDLVQKNRILLVSERFLMIEGILQNQDNVISVKAERVLPLTVTNAETSSHDFH
jgi:DNA polymerase III alpha subunit